MSLQKRPVGRPFKSIHPTVYFGKIPCYEVIVDGAFYILKRRPLKRNENGTICDDGQPRIIYVRTNCLFENPTNLKIYIPKSDVIYLGKDNLVEAMV